MAYNKKSVIEQNINAIESALSGTNDKKLLSLYSGFGGIKSVLLPTDQPELFPEADKALIPLFTRLHDVLKQYSKDEAEYKTYFDSLRISVLTSEKDLLTGKILKALYPEHTVNISGFEEVSRMEEGTFDIATSNIPFGDFFVFDPVFYNSKIKEKRKSCSQIHNYFFLKGADMIREGGIIAYITSTGLMDSPTHESLRKYILKEHNLVSAIRLPENTFLESGTEVQSDLIILQKNSKKEKLTKEESKFIKTDVDKPLNIKRSSYYESTRHIIHTQGRIDTGLYGNPEWRYKHDGGIDGIVKDLQAVLASDISRNFNHSL